MRRLRDIFTALVLVSGIFLSAACDDGRGDYTHNRYHDVEQAKGWVWLGDARSAMEIPGQGVVIETRRYNSVALVMIPDTTMDEVVVANKGRGP